MQFKKMHKFPNAALFWKWISDIWSQFVKRGEWIGCIC